MPASHLPVEVLLIACSPFNSITATCEGSYTVVAYDAGIKCKRAIDQALGRLNASSLLTSLQFPDFLCQQPRDAMPGHVHGGDACL